MDTDNAACPPSLNFVEGVLAASPDCVLLLSLDGTVCFMNRRGVQLNELASVDEVLGRRFTDLWPLDEQPKITRAITGAAGGRVTRAEGFCPTAKGLPRWWETSFSPFVPGLGEPPLIVGISRDITDRRAAEMSARQSQLTLIALREQVETRVAALTNQRNRLWKLSPDLMGVLGADGIFESSNPAWQTVLGWPEDEIARTVFYDFIHPDDLASTRDAFVAASERGEPALRFENRYRHRHGAYRRISWVAVPEDGKVYCIGRDITAESPATPSV